MIFFRRDNIAHFATPAKGDTPIDIDIAEPFRGLALSIAAIAEVLRLHADRFDGGRVANLTGADLRGAYLRGANLAGANLTVANLTGADLRGVYLRGANLTGANLNGVDLRGAYLRRANLRRVNLTGAYLRGAVGLVTPDEEAANIAAAVEAIAAEPCNWNQAIWHSRGYLADKATTVGSCGTAHCLAGWLQALLPIGDDRRRLDAESCGWALAPRAASAGWFDAETHPDLQAMVDDAIARRNASPA